MLPTVPMVDALREPAPIATAPLARVPVVSVRTDNVRLVRTGSVSAVPMAGATTGRGLAEIVRTASVGRIRMLA
ncbi:MAG TPA: hypothetical protein PLR25_18530 [Planctomycetaceae bacterium]|nr:hypothetical protein [Planctomycetaceae bacterium]